MKSVYLFTLFSFALFSCQVEKAAVKYPDTVGDIAFDEKLDEAEFKKCRAGKDRPFSFQYYHGSKTFGYKGEKIAITEKLKKKIYIQKRRLMVILPLDF